jgi:hypothetical protein
MNKHRRLGILHARDPRCFWCRCVTVVLPPVKYRKEYPDDMAVLDRLDDKFDDQRGTYPSGTPRTVLACIVCKRQRSAETNALNVEQQRIRSHPKAAAER